MADPLSRYIEAVTGLTEVTRRRAEQVVQALRKQGGSATDNVQEMVENLLERSQQNRQAITSIVQSETRRAIRSMGLATAEDVERLRGQVAELRKAVRARGAGAEEKQETAQPAAPAKKAAKKTAARKTAKKATSQETRG